MESVERSGEGKEPQEGEPRSEPNKDEEYVRRLKYLQADFENYRKRTEKELREVEENSARNVAVKLLGVVDELELAMAHSGNSEGAQLREGVEMVYKKLGGVLESLGLEKISCVGQKFDPAYHEAVEKVTGDGPEDIVVQELRSGFSFRGHVLRPSMVKVQLAKQRVEEEEES